MAHGMFRLFSNFFIDVILVRRALRCRRRTTRYFAGFVLSQNLSKMCCSCAENIFKPWSEAFLVTSIAVISRLISVSMVVRLHCWARAAAAHNSGHMSERKSIKFSRLRGLAWISTVLFWLDSSNCGSEQGRDGRLCLASSWPIHDSSTATPVSSMRPASIKG